MISLQVNENLLVCVKPQTSVRYLTNQHYLNFNPDEGSHCGRAFSVMDLHTTGSGFKTRLARHFLLSFRLITTMTASSWTFVGVCGRSGISQCGLTQDIKMGSCIFQSDVPHQWIAQQQVGPVSVYCDGAGCHVPCLRHGIPMWQHIGQSTTATSRHRCDMTSDV